MEVIKQKTNTNLNAQSNIKSFNYKFFIKLTVFDQTRILLNYCMIYQLPGLSLSLFFKLIFFISIQFRYNLNYLELAADLQVVVVAGLPGEERVGAGRHLLQGTPLRSQVGFYLCSVFVLCTFIHIICTYILYILQQRQVFFSQVY